MIPEERFGRWTAIGVPSFLGMGVVGTVAIHFGYRVPWRQLLPPAGLFVGIQIGFYLCAFWAGKQARHQDRFWPMSLLSGFYLWAAGLMVLYYGSSWGILPPYGGWLDFTIAMVLVTVVLWLLAVKFGRRLTSGQNE